MELTATPRLQRIGSIIIFLTIVPIIVFAVFAFLTVRAPRYDVALIETGELFTVTEPVLWDGDGYHTYEVRQAGRRELLGEAKGDEESYSGIGNNNTSLCVRPASASHPQEGCLFFFNPKTRQASVARFE